MRKIYNFVITYDLYKEIVNKEGNLEYKLSKKDCTKKWTCYNLNEITNVREASSEYGRVYKNKCEVFHSPESKWITVRGTFKEIEQLLKPEEIKQAGYGKKL